MKRRYLEVTFRKGKPFAAYLYLPRPTGTRAARTVDAGRGVQVDFDEGGPRGAPPPLRRAGSPATPRPDGR